jgi:hypothetical protein
MCVAEERVRPEHARLHDQASVNRKTPRIPMWGMGRTGRR